MPGRGTAYRRRAENIAGRKSGTLKDYEDVPVMSSPGEREGTREMDGGVGKTGGGLSRVSKSEILWENTRRRQLGVQTSGL